jgi:hypothetical protein
MFFKITLVGFVYRLLPKKTVFQRLIMKQCVGTSVICSYNGLGDRLKQTVNETEKDFSLNLNAGLTQVLAYRGDTYLYGLNWLGYDNSGETYQYLADTLGSVRQVVKGGVTLKAPKRSECNGTSRVDHNFCLNVSGLEVI